MRVCSPPTSQLSDSKPGNKINGHQLSRDRVGIDSHRQLGVQMNNSMHSVQHIHDHMAKYLQVPASCISRCSKNYVFEFLESINSVIHAEIMSEIRQSLFYTLIIDESTDISVSKILTIYFKFRDAASAVHKTVFGGIVKLTSCNAPAITTAVKDFYTLNQLDMMKMVMFTSDGASVTLGKNNGVAARLKQSIPHSVEQHCVAHREDLGIVDDWNKVPMIKEMETLLRTIYTIFCRSSVRKGQFEEIANVTECEAVPYSYPYYVIIWKKGSQKMNSMNGLLSILLHLHHSYEFGTENIEKLVNKYRQILVLGQARSSGQNIMNEMELIVSQYNDYKYLIVEKIETKSLKTFQDMVTFSSQNAERYSVVSQLVDICAMFQASSADCERGFSLMNNIKTKSRNGLKENHFDMLMRIKSHLSSGKEVNLDKI
ncbi:uncharacterized protein [Heptranchias perlo]|uniref:uncharacterized protein n=1 Tax=Heptranchias perlo TaxID=212740 RepID=UPI003559C298